MALLVCLQPCPWEGKQKPVGSSEKERLKRSLQSALMSHWEEEKEVTGLSLLLKESTWQAEPCWSAPPCRPAWGLAPHRQAQVALALRSPCWGRALHPPTGPTVTLWKRQLAVGKGGGRGEGREADSTYAAACSALG